MNISLSGITCRFACALFAVAIPATAAPIVGPTGNFYDVILAQGLTWDDANAAANASTFMGLPGHLVTITSAAEDVFIDVLRASLLTGEVWVGGFQNPITEPDPFTGWTWVNGEGSFPGVLSASPYANWQSGEPNDAYDTATDLATEQHLTIGFFGLGGGWNDEGAIGQVVGYAVEYETPARVPENGPLTLVSFLTFAGMFLVHGCYLNRSKKFAM